jgi:hypothetical protein
MGLRCELKRTLSLDVLLTVIGVGCMDRPQLRRWRICLMMREGFCLDCIRYVEVVARVDGSS